MKNWTDKSKHMRDFQLIIFHGRKFVNGRNYFLPTDDENSGIGTVADFWATVELIVPFNDYMMLKGQFEKIGDDFEMKIEDRKYDFIVW